MFQPGGCRSSVGRDRPASARSGFPLPEHRQQRGVSRPSQKFTRGVLPTRVNPEVARETAVSKLEQALQLMSDCPGVAVDLLKQELEGSRSVTETSLNVEVEQCRKFIARAEKRVAELDAERAAEFNALTKAQGRLQRSEAEQVAPGTFRTIVALPRSCRDQCAEGQISRGGRAERCRDAFKQTTSDHEYSFAGRGTAHAPDKSAERVERLVAVVSRRVGRSIGFGERDQGDGVDFSIVRWRGKVVRVDGGHVAVRS